MAKPRTLANTVSDGGPLADGAIAVADVTGLQTALDAKLNTSALGSTVQAQLVSGTNIKTVNSTSLLGSGDVAVQATLVSGTNIKTINSTSLLGSGDITITTSGSGGTTASGNVTLTAASAGAQSITTPGYGGFVKLPDATTMTKAAINFNIRNAGNYPIKVLDSASNILGFISPKLAATIGCADNSTAAGVWVIEGTEPLATTLNYLNNSLNFSTRQFCTALDDSRTFISFTNTSSELYGVVYDSATGTFGSATLISGSLTGDSSTGFTLSSNSVLIAYSRTSLACGRVLSISGTTITVNAEATAASSLAMSSPSFTQVGSAYVLDRSPPTTSYLQVFTVSGTTVSIGAEVAADGIIAFPAYSTGSPTLYPVSSSVFARFSYTNSTAVYARAYSISGTTITSGALLTLATGSAYLNGLKSFVCGSQWALVYMDGGNSPRVSIISISGTTCTSSSVTAISQAIVSGNNLDALVSGNKVIVAAITSSAPASVYFNIVTNSSGTASAGTQTGFASIGSVGFQSMMAFSAYSNLATFGMNMVDMGPQTFGTFVINYAGSSPVIVDIPKIRNQVPNGTTYDGNILSLPRNQFGRAYALLGSTSIGNIYSFYGVTQTGNGVPILAVNAGSFSVPYSNFRTYTTSAVWQTTASPYESWNGTKSSGNLSFPGTFITRVECASV